MRYANPITGGNVFPPSRSNPVDAEGIRRPDLSQHREYHLLRVEGGPRDRRRRRIVVRAHDVFTVPSWIPYRVETKADCVLFYSNRGAQETLGLFREEDPSNAR